MGLGEGLAADRADRESLPDRPESRPTDEQIAEAYLLAALYVQALLNRRRSGQWRSPSGETVKDRDPLPEDFLPPAEALRMRDIGDPLKALVKH